MIVNHVGLCVTDLARSTCFYEALGFEVALDLELPDDRTRKLTGLESPIDLHAVYLVNGSFVLELLAFDPDHHPGARIERDLADTGLTHLSLGVDDLEASRAVIIANGGEILGDTDVGAAVMARDPDGQLLELLRTDLRPVTPDPASPREGIGLRELGGRHRE